MSNFAPLDDRAAEMLGLPETNLVLDPQYVDALTAAENLDVIELARAKAKKDPWGDKGLRSHQRIAARFAKYAEGRCLYVLGLGWTYWDGKRWAVDNRAAHANKILAELLKASWIESMSDKDLARDVTASMTASGSAGVLDLASRQLFAAEVDADPYLLNCQNGTLNLRTLTLREHDPADLITKVTRANYNGAALSSTWIGFLESSLPVVEVREFLQRFAGSALIGTVMDHVLVIATGTGRNGKGVLSRAISKALGDYAITGSNSMLIASKYGQQSAGEQASKMRLRGSRWVVMAELEKGAKLAPSTMKSLTGGDTIEAKYMGQNPVQFAPSHSIFMETNFLPAVDAEDAAVWARLRVVPFDVSFAGKEDKTLEERIEADLDAVLAWIVSGLWAYHQEGLNAPEAVTSRTEAYQAENDSVKQFMAEECVRHQNARVTRSELHHAYLDWARENGAESLTPKVFAPRVAGLPGISEGKTGGNRIWKGVGLSNDEPVLD